jgi:hypothetical protein
LEQVELADRLGIDYVWVQEHHFLEEYCHSSAPEVFLAACSQRTKKHSVRTWDRCDVSQFQSPCKDRGTPCNTGYHQLWTRRMGYRRIRFPVWNWKGLV